MPIYEYHCKKCDQSLDLLVPYHLAQAPVTCETCGEELARKLTTYSSYSIKGNNSASVTPKKYRGGK